MTLITMTLCGSIINSAAADQAAADLQKKANQWISLFNGKDLDGWRGYNKKTVSKAWTVNNQGEIELTGRGGDLITKTQYQDYELKLEWKFKNGVKKANAGIFIGAQESKHPIYRSALEMQVVTNDGFPNLADKHIAGSCYGLYPSKRSWAKPAGEWNQVHIICKGSTVKMSFNGNLVANFDTASAKFKQLKNQTKFKAWPEFASFTKGHIGIQDHGDSKGLMLRNIKLRHLTK